MDAIRRGLGAKISTIAPDSSVSIEGAISRVYLTQALSEVCTDTICTKLIFGSRILLLVCLSLSKVSIALFTRKMFSGDLNHESPISGVYFAVLGVAGVVSVVISSAGCRTSYLLASRDSLFCPANVLSTLSAPSYPRLQSLYTARWILICILDVTTEICVTAVQVFLTSRLNLQSSNKLRIFALFSFRLGWVHHSELNLRNLLLVESVIAFAIGQTVIYLNKGGGSVDYSLTLVLQDLPL